MDSCLFSRSLQLPAIGFPLFIYIFSGFSFIDWSPPTRMAFKIFHTIFTNHFSLSLTEIVAFTRHKNRLRLNLSVSDYSCMLKYIIYMYMYKSIILNVYLFRVLLPLTRHSIKRSPDLCTTWNPWMWTEWFVVTDCGAQLRPNEVEKCIKWPD